MQHPWRTRHEYHQWFWCCVCFFSSSKTRTHTRSNSSSSEACSIFIATLRVSRFWMHVADPQSDPSRSQSRGTLDVIQYGSTVDVDKRKTENASHLWISIRINEKYGWYADTTKARAFWIGGLFLFELYLFFFGSYFFGFCFFFYFCFLLLLLLLFAAFAFASAASASFAASAAFCRSSVFLFLSFIILLACASIS